ncbi:low-density lipoprotein receptor-related protein 1-like [Ornithodoros turicata]|uniref:low-density lipoprotein receptor-related protein 1-like n=1 Tax=Ornithodoros turicata TaxID=34597 RepID=UPI003138E6D1
MGMCPLFIILSLTLVHVSAQAVLLTACPNSTFTCGNGRCVSVSYVCDGDNDCQNNRDEDVCRNGCPRTHFECHNATSRRKCIPKSFVCNLNDDCIDGEDEKQCVPRCTAAQFLCRDNTSCVARRVLCDGERDCADGSDEVGCFDSCSESEVPCNVFGRPCLSKRHVCDGVQDCLNGTDETNCIRQDPEGHRCGSCPEGQFECRDQLRCLRADKRCDGDVDCNDGSDEVGCPQRVICNSTQFLCNDGTKCILRGQVCDNVTHCSDGSDEFGCDPCEKANCSQRCTSFLNGTTVCSCHHGYRLLPDGVTCEDIDECVGDNPGCSHICTNRKGSRSCSCFEGYRMLGDSICKAEGADAVMVFAVRNMIKGKSLNANRIYDIHPTKGDASAVEVDIERRKLYWAITDSEGSTVHSCFLNGTDFKVVAHFSRSKIEDIAWDWFSRNLYLLDSWRKRIVVCTHNGDACGDLIVDNIKVPGNLVLVPHSSTMYWTELGNPVAIVTAGMDGTNATHLLAGDLRHPSGLTYDQITDRLYWCDDKQGTIESLDVPTMRRRTLLGKQRRFTPGNLDNFEDHLFWIDWTTSTFRMSRKFGSNYSAELSIGDTSSMKTFGLYHPVLVQQRTYNPCRENPCRRICLLSPVTTAGYRCMCDDEGCDVGQSWDGCAGQGGRETLTD